MRFGARFDIRELRLPKALSKVNLGAIFLMIAELMTYSIRMLSIYLSFTVSAQLANEQIRSLKALPAAASRRRLAHICLSQRQLRPPSFVRKARQR
jgi:hypothetical protein